MPLQVVQIDHTLVDVVVVDELERLPLGRPWLTLAIDVASRMVTGFYVSLDPPSTLSVAMALTQAVLPKDLWLCDRELDLAWPACGLPELLRQEVLRLAAQGTPKTSIARELGLGEATVYRILAVTKP